MTTGGPSNDVNFQRAWEASSGDDFASRIARKSLAAIALKVDPDWRPPGSMLTTAIEVVDEPGSLVDPWSASKILAALHTAAARLAAANRRRADSHERVSPEDRAAVSMGISAAFSGSLIIQIQENEPHDGGLFARSESSLDIALSELVALFGEVDLTEERVIDKVLTSRQVLRRAVRDLVEHEVAGKVDLKLTLNRRDGSRLAGSLPHELSGMLNVALSTQDESVYFETRRGKLDGFRTSRKEFYFIDDDETEIEGVIDDESNLAHIGQYVERAVEVELAVSTTRLRGGGRATKHYRLMSIRVVDGSEEE